MRDEIRAGASVVLKSGGPVMLVLEVASAARDNIAHVRWFDTAAHEQEAEFPFSALQLAKENVSSRLLSFFATRSFDRRRLGRFGAHLRR